MLALQIFRTRPFAWFLAITAVTATGCKEATVTDVPVVIARIDVSTTTLTLKVGETANVTAVARSASGQSLTARPISWQTSNPSVAQVAPNGDVTAMGVGTAMLTATSGSVSAQVTVTVTLPDFTVNVNNLLRSPVNITINGVAVGSVQATASRSFTIPGAADVRLSWQMVRPATTTGTPLGDQVSGVFDPLPAGNARTFAYEIDNEVGTIRYFGLFIRNTSTERLLIGANVGLTAENLCNCILPNTGTEFYFGYYQLFANSNVRGYREFSNYTGNFIFWDGTQINGLIQPGSGVLQLVTQIAPSEPGSIAVRGETVLPASPAISAPARTGVVQRNDRLPRPGEWIGPATAMQDPFGASIDSRSRPETIRRRIDPDGLRD